MIAEAPIPITYDRWLSSLAGSGTRASDGDHTKSPTMEILQDEPREMGELADIFVNLSVRDLRSAFVALMVDAHTVNPNYPAAALARPLVVVAERLGRARFDDVTLLALKERHLMQASASPAPVQTHPGKQPTSDAFTIEHGPQPQPTRGRAPDELTLAMRTLSSDVWIRVKAKDTTWAKLQTRLKRAKKIGGSKLLFAFRMDDGDYAVCVATNLEQVPESRTRKKTA